MNIMSFGEISKITDSRYRLATLVSTRAREIVDGDEPLVETDLENPVSISMEEVYKGAVKFTTKERFEAIQEEKRKEAEALQRELELAQREEEADGE